MTDQYPFELSRGHIVAEINGVNVLLDTGSPLSFGDCGSLVLTGNEHRISRGSVGVSIDHIREFVGADVGAILGGDLLAGARVEICWYERQVVFSDKQDDMQPSLSTHMALLMGVPVVEIGMSGTRGTAFVDTGATLSYVVTEHTNGLKSSGREHDFHPSIGEFDTEVFELALELCGVEFQLRVGTLPLQLALLLNLTGTSAILGNDLFGTFARITLDYPGEILMATVRA